MYSIILLATFAVGPFLLSRLMTSGSVRLASLLSEDTIAGTLQLGIPWTPRQRSILGQQGPYTPSFLNNTTLPPIWSPKLHTERDEMLSAVIIVSPASLYHLALAVALKMALILRLAPSCNGIPPDILLLRS